jgi:hypothetical protein
VAVVALALLGTIPLRGDVEPSVNVVIDPGALPKVDQEVRWPPRTHFGVFERATESAAAPDSLSKMSSSVRLATTSDMLFRAAILTDDVEALGTSLRSYGVDTSIGSLPASEAGPRVVVVDVPSILLEKIAALDGVWAVAPAVRPEAPVPMDPEGLGALEGGPAPTLIEAGHGHHVPEAWALGYTGTGVRVAPLDSGTDFGHPDLQGTYARVTDLASPYAGWPIAFDPYSMYLHAFRNVTFPLASLSWYADTSFETTAHPGTGLTTTPFNGRTYDVSGIPSASGRYRIGLHPDLTLRQESPWNYGGFVGVLVTDPLVPGVYDTVHVDLDHDLRFGDDKPVTRASPESWADYYDASTGAWDNGSYASGDGIADMSGGLVYFIADGTNPVPYADAIGSRYGVPVPVPDAGDLVAFHLGDADAVGGDHGTLVASAIVAQNATGRVHGFAPGARLISVGNVYAGSPLFYDVFTFAAEGYDGVPGTGDEAHVASASFGISESDADGWDFLSRWIDYHAFAYTYTAYAVSTGNGGHGFGTVTTPGSAAGVIGVGASTSYNAALAQFDYAAHATVGDVQPWSNRGPSTSGLGKPDLVTVGAWASGDGALNSFDGRLPPWRVWGGTSLSAPAAAALVALVVEAHALATGGPVPNDLAESFLTAGADNIHYDPLVMGHGLANALRSVRAAALLDGVTAVDASGAVPAGSWVAGDYRGTRHAAFARILSPGQADTTTFDLWNWDPSDPVTVSVADWELRRSRTDVWTVNASTADESPADPVRPDYLIDLTPSVPAGTALLRATVSFPFASFDPEFNYLPNSRWRVLLYDWVDYDGNGSAWRDANGNGAVNNGELDGLAGGELNRFSYGYPTHTNVQALVHDPLDRIGDGLLLGIQHGPAATVPTTSLTVTVEYFEAVDAPWLSASASVVTIPAGPASVPVDLAVDLPADAPLGTRSGAVTVSGPTGETQIPVLVNVAASGPTFSFGGDPDGRAFLDPSRTTGGPDWAWRAESGDWRFVFADIPDATPIGPGDRLLVHTRWERTPTDIDTIVLGPVADPLFSPSSLWGPYALDVVGRSSNTYMSSGRYAFQTATGGAEEWVAAPLAAGLHEIVLHNVLFAGPSATELFSGEVGRIGASPSPWNMSTSSGTGVRAFTLDTSLGLPGLEVRAFGLSVPSATAGLTIADQGTYMEEFTASAIGLIDVSIEDPAGVAGLDLDLYVERWSGTEWARVGASAGPDASERVRVTMPADGRYRIRVFGLAVPPAGAAFDLSRLVIAGSELAPRDIPAGPIAAGAAAFNVTYDIDAGTRPGAYQGIVFVGPPAAPVAEAIANFVLTDASPPVVLGTLPSAGGFTNDPGTPIVVDYEDPAVSSGLVDVTFTLDGFDHTYAGTWNATRFTWSFPFDLAEGVHAATISLEDGVGLVTTYAWTFTVDTAGPSLSLSSPSYELTRDPIALVAGTTDPGAGVAVNGAPVFVDPSGAFSTTLVLSEGPNPIDVVAADAAGNEARISRSVTLDTVAPALTVLAPADGAVFNSTAVFVGGRTEPGALVTANAAVLATDAGGTFGGEVAMSPGDRPDGRRVLAVTARDAAGNEATALRNVTIDVVAPITDIGFAGTRGLDGWYVSAVAVTLAAQDAASGVASVEYRANGGPWVPYGVPFLLTDGEWTLEVRARDVAGNAEVPRSADVRVDTVAPVVRILSPSPGYETEDASVEVSGSVDDPAAVVVVDGQPVVPDPGSGRWRATVPLVPGRNAIDVYARDPAGNVGEPTLPPLSPLLVTYVSPLDDLQEGLLGTMHAVGLLSSALQFGLAAVLVVLVALQLVLFRNLRAKVESLRPRREPPEAPPEGPPEAPGEPPTWPPPP